MSVHIYTRPQQPATLFHSYLLTKRHTTRINPRATVPTSCCRKRRWAKYCTVQVFYDMVPFWCRPGKGCKR